MSARAIDISSLPAKLNRQFVPILVIASMLWAFGHEQVRRVPDAGKKSRQIQATPIATRRSSGEPAAIVAVRQIDVPYRYGGPTVKRFDCSGLVQYACARAGKSRPWTTADQWRQMSPVTACNLEVGDLLFFRIDGTISHVGLYPGSRQFVHAPSSGREVTIAELDLDYYRRLFVRGRRPE